MKALQKKVFKYPLTEAVNDPVELIDIMAQLGGLATRGIDWIIEKDKRWKNKWTIYTRGDKIQTEADSLDDMSGAEFVKREAMNEIGVDELVYSMLNKRRK